MGKDFSRQKKAAGIITLIMYNIACFAVMIKVFPDFFFSRTGLMVYYGIVTAICLFCLIYGFILMIDNGVKKAVLTLTISSLAAAFLNGTVLAIAIQALKLAWSGGAAFGLTFVITLFIQAGAGIGLGFLTVSLVKLRENKFNKKHNLKKRHKYEDAPKGSLRKKIRTRSRITVPIFCIIITPAVLLSWIYTSGIIINTIDRFLFVILINTAVFIGFAVLWIILAAVWFRVFPSEKKVCNKCHNGLVDYSKKVVDRQENYNEHYELYKDVRTCRICGYAEESSICKHSFETQRQRDETAAYQANERARAEQRKMYEALGEINRDNEAHQREMERVAKNIDWEIRNSYWKK